MSGFIQAAKEGVFSLFSASPREANDTDLANAICRAGSNPEEICSILRKSKLRCSKDKVLAFLQRNLQKRGAEDIEAAENIPLSKGPSCVVEDVDLHGEQGSHVKQEPTEEKLEGRRGDTEFTIESHLECSKRKREGE
jgi:hypothetical protein